VPELLHAQTFNSSYSLVPYFAAGCADVPVLLHSQTISLSHPLVPDFAAGCATVPELLHTQQISPSASQPLSTSGMGKLLLIIP